MSKVESLDGFYFFKKSESKKAKKRKKIEGTNFSSVLESGRKREAFLNGFDEEAHGDTLEELLDEVHSSGDALKSSQSIQNIKKYKGAVKAFLDFVLDKILQVEQKTSGVNILKRKRFTQIKVIDQRLQSLLTGILQNQVEQLKILQEIEEINGLLVDLLT